MNKKTNLFLTKIILIAFFLIIIFPVFPALGEGSQAEKAWVKGRETVNEAVYSELATQALRNSFNAHQKGTLVDGEWGNFGANDAYILKKAGANLEKWEYNGISFQEATLDLINQTITNENGDKKSIAKRVAEEYLAAQAFGEVRKAPKLLSILKQRQINSGNGSFDNNPFNDIPALEALGRSGAISEIETQGALTYLLSQQDVGGAWTTTWNDFMATAQAVRALTYLKPYATEEVKDKVDIAISKGLKWMKALQRSDGGFQDSEGWDDPLADTVEVIYTLSLLDIDFSTWLSEKGKSPVDYMVDKAINQDGSFGKFANPSSNTSALDAYLKLGGKITSDTVIGLIVNPVNAEITVGNTKQFTSTAFKLNGESQDISDMVTWSVENEKIATIDNSGLLQGIMVGETVIKALYLEIVSSTNIKVIGTGGGGTLPVEEGTVITIQVIGKNGETLYSGKLSLTPDDTYGVTVLGALHKTGLSYRGSLDFVESIAGQRNQGLAGWMYKVNGNIPTGTASNYRLNSSDRVLWFYSISSENIAGIGGINQLPINKPLEKTGDELVREQIDKEKEIIISLTDREEASITLGKETFEKLIESHKPLIIQNAGVELCLEPRFLITEEIRKALAFENADIKVIVKEVTNNQAKALIEEGLAQKDLKIVNLANEIYELSFQINTLYSDGSKTEEKLLKLSTPIRINIDLSNTNMSEEDIVNLTGVRYELDEEGNYFPINLGGIFNPLKKTFSFYTDSFGLHSVMKVHELKKVSLGINKLTVFVNGETNWTDTPPIIINNRTMVPVRMIAEVLGAEVKWLPEINTVVIKSDTKVISLGIDELLEGMDTPITIYNNRTMVPLRFISEYLGATVIWFSETETIEIIK